MQSWQKDLLSEGALSLRAALGAIIAYWLAQICQLQHPIYALVAAIIVTDFSRDETSRLGFQRLAATVVGAVSGVILSITFGPAWWVVGLGIFITMVACQACGIGAGAKVAAFICAIIVIDQNAQPWMYALHRFLETIIGISVAWIVSLVPRFIRFDD
jgi:uncharacterized membrane protein YgaE (UPF0421/DUF939 family)